MTAQKNFASKTIEEAFMAKTGDQYLRFINLLPGHQPAAARPCP
jgi:hypothetical protein